MIKVLIAEDSVTDEKILKAILSSDSDIIVVGVAHDGLEAIALAEKLKPDIITMDINMPKMNGYDAIDHIMQQCPVPIVVISSLINDKDSDATFRALEAGALTVLPKPVQIQSPLFPMIQRNIVDTIKSMAEIKVIRKRKLGMQTHPQKFSALAHGAYRIIVVGASVGGPQVLKDILEKLPANFPVPIVVVQHMSIGFIEGYVKWLNSHVSLNVKFAEQDEILKPGHVYFASDNLHLLIRKENNSLKATLAQGQLISGFCPSISVLMNSAAQCCQKSAIGLLLTGMGSDGAEGMQAIKQQGGHTVIQDAESCVVFGMGQVAQSLGCVDKVVDLDKIAEYLIRVTNRKTE